MTKLNRSLVLFVLLLALLAPSIPPAHAAPIACTELAFRTALDAGGTIDLPPGCTITATGAAFDDANLTGDFDVTVNVTINGAADGSTVIDGGGVDRVFHVMPGVTAIFNNITIQNGNAAGGGLTITAGTVSGRPALFGGGGGGIYNSGTLTLIYSTVSGNTAGAAPTNGTLPLTAGRPPNGAFVGVGGGGGIYNNGTLTLIHSTVSGNTVIGGAVVDVAGRPVNGAFFGGSGGGIYNSVGLMTISPCNVITGNTAPLGGGMYIVGGTTNINNSSIYGNTTLDGASAHVHYAVPNSITAEGNWWGIATGPVAGIDYLGFDVTSWLTEPPDCGPIRVEPVCWDPNPCTVRAGLADLTQGTSITDGRFMNGVFLATDLGCNLGPEYEGSWGYSYMNTDGTDWTPLGSRDADGNYIVEEGWPLTAAQLQEAVEAHEPHLGPRCFAAAD